MIRTTIIASVIVIAIIVLVDILAGRPGGEPCNRADVAKSASALNCSFDLDLGGKR